MKLLHTADWHVGRTIRGRSRAAEHRAVLAQITELAREHEVDAVIVAGDQFDVQAPSPEAEDIVWAALTQLADIAPVAVIAGNHDNPRRLEAVRGLLRANQIHAVGNLTRADDGGLLRIDTRDGTPLNLALLPFMHHRNAVKAVDLLDPAKADGEYGRDYNNLYATYAHALCADMDPAEVNVLVGHVTTFGGLRGGGEREAHSIERYCIDARALPQQLDYVALGHLHVAQQVSSAPPVRYCGAPLMMDFGESDKACSATLVTLEPGKPAGTELLPLTAGRALRTVRGTYQEVMELDPAALTAPQDADADPDDPAHGAWIRVLLSGAVPAGVGELVRDRLGDDVVDVRLDRRDDDADQQVDATERIGRPPTELFDAYLDEQQVNDSRISALFAQLLEDELTLEEGEHAAS